MKRLALLTTLLLTLLSGLTLAEPPSAHAQTFSCNNVTEIPVAECNELVTLFNSTGGANWKNNTGWLNTNTPCSWFGITCSAGHVREIGLGDDGNISDEIYGNNLIGTIPNLNLPNLTWLVLHTNQLSGTIPNFSNLPNLLYLYLSTNQLSGTIPNFTNLPNLRFLFLHTNQLSGTIPNFANLPNLTYLSLHNSQLSGTIPNFTNLPNLVFLDLYNNQLSGNIPNFSNLPRLDGLSLYSNQLSGTIPNFSNLPNLTYLYLNYNQLSGTIPNLNWSSFSGLTLNNNCGLVAFDETQATVLTSKDPNWQVRNPDCSNSATPTATISPPTVTPTSTNTPIPTPTPQVAPPDSYESDNSCPAAKTITTDGLAQSHTFHVSGDEDWVKFEGTVSTTYLIDVSVPDSSTADVAMVMWDKCNGNATPNDSFNPEIHLQFKAPSNGTYFMHLTDNNDNGGAEVTYQLSVRTVAEAASPGALVLVAGKLRANDSLQTNIHNVTNNVYRLFTHQGYPPERITYLANDLNLNPDGDELTKDVDNLARRDNLQLAISQAADKVGPDRAFTLYMMDHGNEDKFYLNGSNQTVAPDELSSWLDALEAAAPGVKVNVIIDACYSGSFIKGAKRLGKPGRVIIASTTDQTSAYSSPAQGAIFSDSFLQGLGQKRSLYDSFMEGQRAAGKWHADQIAMIDSNGNGIPNEAADFSEAQRRGFAYAGTFSNEGQPPYIALANGPTQIKNGQGELQAVVKDDVTTGKLAVWAVIYKPSYVPPASSEELVADIENLPTIKLNGPDSNQMYRGLYEGFNESGTYRIVIYAVDEDGLQSRPREVSVTVGGVKIYLPMIVK